MSLRGGGGKDLLPIFARSSFCASTIVSIFLPIRFLSGSTARTDKFLVIAAPRHCSQLDPPSHVAPPLGRGSHVVTADARDLLQRFQESPRMLRRVLASRAPHPTEKIDIPST